MIVDEPQVEVSYRLPNSWHLELINQLTAKDINLH